MRLCLGHAVAEWDWGREWGSMDWQTGREGGREAWRRGRHRGMVATDNMVGNESDVEAGLDSEPNLTHSFYRRQETPFRAPAGPLHPCSPAAVLLQSANELNSIKPHRFIHGVCTVYYEPPCMCGIRAVVSWVLETGQCFGSWKAFSSAGLATCTIGVCRYKEKAWVFDWSIIETDHRVWTLFSTSRTGEGHGWGYSFIALI